MAKLGAVFNFDFTYYVPKYPQFFNDLWVVEEIFEGILDLIINYYYYFQPQNVLNLRVRS